MANCCVLLQIHTIVSMPFEENTYVVWLDGHSDAVVIDPGLEPDLIVDFLSSRRLQVAAILNTHGHADHIAGNEEMKRHFPAAPLVIGTNETPLLSDPRLNVSAMFGFSLTSPPADRTVAGGEVIEYAGVALEVRDLPGHSQGHVVYLWRGRPALVFGGDTLFRGSIGRPDFPGGNGPLLLEGIRGQLFTLPDDTVVYPGHGPATTVGHEKRANPYLA